MTGAAFSYGFFGVFIFQLLIADYVDHYKRSFRDIALFFVACILVWPFMIYKMIK